MEKIYSQVNPQELLHVVYKASDFAQGRSDLTPEHTFIQVSAMTFPQGKEVGAHKHIKNNRTSDITQESLIVVEGAIEANYYDLDHKPIKSVILNPGDCTVTLRGGHSFKILEHNTKVYEVKNGPYKGKENDSVKL